VVRVSEKTKEFLLAIGVFCALILAGYAASVAAGEAVRRDAAITAATVYNCQQNEDQNDVLRRMVKTSKVAVDLKTNKHPDLKRAYHKAKFDLRSFSCGDLPTASNP
jgi:hypothetical protein